MDRSSCTAHRHGTRWAYRDGCRCDDAREDRRLYVKRWRAGRNPVRRVPALGYARMVRALQATGWPLWRQAEIGKVKLRVLKTVGQHPWLCPENAARIDKVYRQLSGQDGPSRHTENRAWAAGYPPPGAWVGRDIHDPDSQPDWIRPDDPDSVAAEQVACGQRRWADLRSEGERLAAYQLAVRGGVSQRSMQTEWKVSSRVITRLNRLENAP